MRKLERPTRYLTFSNTGPEVSGPYILGFALGQPDLLLTGDQFDLTAVVSGPSETNGRELYAGGLGYRLGLGSADTTGYVNFDFGDLLLGTEETLLLDARGHRQQIVLGLRHQLSFGETGRLRLDGQWIARNVQSKVLDQPVMDESLRMLRLAAVYTDGRPFEQQNRMALVLTQGFGQFGASDEDNPLASVPGADQIFCASPLPGKPRCR